MSAPNYGFKSDLIKPQKHTIAIPTNRPINYNWIESNVCKVPKNAVKGGIDSDGSVIFIGRAKHNNDLIPAKVIPAKKAAYFSYASQEISTTRCEILCKKSFEWVSSFGGNVPSGAVEGGKTKEGEGETLFVGRVKHNGITTVGKIHPSHGCLYVPYGGKELSFKNYETLTYK